LSNKTGKKSPWIFAPAGVIATACLAVVVYSFIQKAPDGQNLIDENSDLVLVFESFDLYYDPDVYEDLEFHEWLDAYEPSSQG